MTLRRLSRLLPALVCLLAACGGGGGGGGDAGGGGGGGPGATGAPSGLAYEVTPALHRVGEAATANVPTVTGLVTSFSVAPPLPAGLTLDPLTGALGGTPTQEAPLADHVVTATGPGGSTQVTLPVLVGPPLPPEVAFLAPGFDVQAVATGLDLPCKMALAPDGRLFFAELKTGAVRVIDAGGALLSTPFATVTVQGGGAHQGLLALALAPDFAASGHLYVLYTAPADATHAADHARLERFTDVAGAGTNRTVILDGLPAGFVNNGADLVFDLDGNLCLSLGDADVPANAQSAASASGKVLRLTPAGAAPADNPTPGSLVWCSGLRNTFGLAVHPVLGGLYGVDNGPAADDELNYLAPGKNFGWGAVAAIPGAQAGLRMRTWATEIVPTAIAWHPGAAWGEAFADDLFIASYDDDQVLRYEMSGSPGQDLTDIDVESVFLTFVASTTDRKPLDLLVAPDGSLLVLTFTGIWRVTKL